MIMNIHIALLALSGVGFRESRERIASSPKGVAALPMPKRFADIFMLMRRIASVFLCFLPKRSVVTGERRRDTTLVMPLASATSIMPDQKHIMGRRVTISSNALLSPLFKTVTAVSPPCITAENITPIIIIKAHI